MEVLIIFWFCSYLLVVVTFVVTFVVNYLQHSLLKEGALVPQVNKPFYFWPAFDVIW